MSAPDRLAAGQRAAEMAMQQAAQTFNSEGWPAAISLLAPLIIAAVFDGDEDDKRDFTAGFMLAICHAAIRNHLDSVPQPTPEEWLQLERKFLH